MGSAQLSVLEQEFRIVVSMDQTSLSSNASSVVLLLSGFVGAILTSVNHVIRNK